MKVCNRCKQERPASDYWKDSGSKDGLQGRCKDCFNRAYRGEICPRCNKDRTHFSESGLCSWCTKVLEAKHRFETGETIKKFTM